MSYTVLAAIGKVEFNRYINIWGGRMQIPTERGELAGPFHQATHDPFKTPSFPQGFSTKFGSGGAGRYGHDEGVTFWGNLEPRFIPGTLGYAGGIYRGLQSSTPMRMGPNQENSVSFAGRLTYNFLNPEINPGFYTRSTYFGKAGDILAACSRHFLPKGRRGIIHPSQRFPRSCQRYPVGKSFTAKYGCSYGQWRIQKVLRQLFSAGLCQPGLFLHIRWAIVDGNRTLFDTRPHRNRTTPAVR